jgi:hypothetical protein
MWQGPLASFSVFFFFKKKEKVKVKKLSLEQKLSVIVSWGSQHIKKYEQMNHN